MTNSEESIFKYFRLELERLGWVVVAGQAARGSTDLPVVQARIGSSRGSTGAIKPDLIATRADALLVVEIKPGYSSSDVEKCSRLANSQPLQKYLISELADRNLWQLNLQGNPIAPNPFLTAIAYAGLPQQLNVSACFAMNNRTRIWHSKLPLSLKNITAISSLLLP